MGFSVRIFIPTGEPEGLRIVEKSNWTGQGLFLPRLLYPVARDREEFSRTGVYILWGPGEAGEMDRAYVGEGDLLRLRLDDHFKHKDFWTRTITFTSKDQNLNKAHFRYIEARLVELATEAKRCQLDNANNPQSPSLSDADAADADLFLADMLLCLPVLGVSFFEKPAAREESSQDLFLNSKGVRARGYEDVGGFVVRAGSHAVKDEVASIHAYLSSLRSTLVSEGLLVDDGGVYRLVEPYVFSSPSTASGVLLGRSSNGRVEWKDAKGRSLKEIQLEDATAP